MPARRCTEGLKLEASLGVNPFKFGFVSGTDTHTGLATAEEDNFFGKHTGVEPSARPLGARCHQDPAGQHQGLADGSGWLHWRVGDREHARSDLGRLEAQGGLLDHRATHAVRFFGGWDFEPSDAENQDAGGSRLCQGRSHGRRPSYRA